LSEVLERLELPPERGSIPRARQFLRKVLSDEVPLEALEIAELLTSELVTNAVLHSGTPLEVRVRQHRSRVRVEVADRTVDRPVLRANPDPLALNGRGLQFVDRLSTKWGVSQERHGKVVWFEV
jgi:anti-sigma regulatory factor (Ser/Thr protein kinase)